MILQVCSKRGAGLRSRCDFLDDDGRERGNACLSPIIRKRSRQSCIIRRNQALTLNCYEHVGDLSPFNSFTEYELLLNLFRKELFGTGYLLGLA